MLDLNNVYALLPPNFTRHFEHTEEFMDWWEDYVGDQFVMEVGAGCCDFTKAMHERSIKAMAIEPRANDDVRMECSSFLLPRPVEDAAILGKHKAVVVAARPDHSGWFYQLPELIHPESELIYIGLESNFDKDLDGFDYEILFHDAGADGEKVLKVSA